MLTSLHLKLHKQQESIRIEPKPFAGGGEGNLYHIAEPLSMSHRYIVKIYHPHKLTLIRQEKLRYLLENPPTELGTNDVNPSVVWVRDLVFNDSGNIIGLIMPFVKGEKLELLSTLKLPKNVDPAWERFALGSEKSLHYRLRLCFNIAAALQQVHSTSKYILVDLKPDNIVIQLHGIISLVDMDSVEVVKGGESLFDAPVATPEYTPPEYYRALEHDPTARQAWDRFSMAVIFYKLLFGIHPFAAGSKAPFDGCLTLEQKIEAGIYVHSEEKKPYLSVVPPPHLEFNKLNSELKELFRRTFEDGHIDPEMRPNAEEWCVEFLTAIDDPKLSSTFGHLALPTSVDQIKVMRRLPSELIMLEEYSKERAGNVAPEWWNKMDELFKPNPIPKVLTKSDLITQKKSKIKFGWIGFGILVFLYNFSGNNIGEFIEDIADGVSRIIVGFLKLAGIDTDYKVLFFIVFLVLFLMVFGRLAKIGQYFLTKEFRQKYAIQKQFKKVNAEFEEMKSNLENTVNRFNSSSTESISAALFEENNLKLAKLKELIKSKDADVVKLMGEEKAAYRDLHNYYLQKAKNVSALLGYNLGNSLSEIRKDLNSNKSSSLSWKEADIAFDQITKEYQAEFKKLKEKYNQNYSQIMNTVQETMNSTEQEIIKTELEKRKELEAKYIGKITISDLKDMQREFQIKKNKLEDLEFEKEKYKEISYWNYLK